MMSIFKKKHTQSYDKMNKKPRLNDTCIRIQNVDAGPYANGHIFQDT